MTTQVQRMEKRSHPPLRRVTRGEPLLVDPTLSGCEIDSCYSSCSEESHSSLSRESSDALSTVDSGISSLRLGLFTPFKNKPQNPHACALD